MRSSIALLALCLPLVACEPQAGPQADAGAEASPASEAADGSTVVAPPPAAPWPALPRGGPALEALIEAQTRRPIAELAPLTVDQIVASLREATRDGSLVGGWRPIAAALSKQLLSKQLLPKPALSKPGPRNGRSDVYLLFGSFHDAPGQLDAFRQLLGPLGIAPAPLLALEQLQADGAWTGTDESQAGDDAALGRYLVSGDEGALQELDRTQRERDYTAWKYGYVEKVADVVTSARASGRRLVGCDMPSALQARVRAELGERGELLRDLHCALALRRALASAASSTAVALFIGDAHLSPERLPRFLPTEATVVRIHLVGERVRGGGIEPELAQRLAITEPLLFAVGDARFVLLLPDVRLAASVDRLRSRGAIDAVDRQQVVVEGFGGSAQLGGQRAELGGTTRFAVGPGSVPFFLEHPGRAIAGTVDLPAGGSVLLAREPDGTARIHIRAPAR